MDSLTWNQNEFILKLIKTYILIIFLNLFFHLNKKIFQCSVGIVQKLQRRPKLDNFRTKFEISQITSCVFLCSGSDGYSFELYEIIWKKERKNNYFLTWISAQVKEMGGFVFRNCEIHFSRVFWVRNKWKMFDFRAVARKSHFSRVSNPKYKGKV